MSTFTTTRVRLCRRDRSEALGRVVGPLGASALHFRADREDIEPDLVGKRRLLNQVYAGVGLARSSVL